MEREAAEKARRQEARKAALERMLKAAKVVKSFAGERKILRENPEEQRRARRVQRVTTKIAVVRTSRLCSALIDALREASADSDGVTEALSSHIEQLTYLLECQGPYDSVYDLTRAMNAASNEMLGADHRLTLAIASR